MQKFDRIKAHDEISQGEHMPGWDKIETLLNLEEK